MKTTHQIYFQNAKDMSAVPSNSVDLIVTSPPYPMIEMWDFMFISQNPEIEEKLTRGDGSQAFELMHRELDPVWNEVYRVLKGGGFACINIGDATRTVRENFMLYPNHSRILSHMLTIGFTTLPVVLWRKQTNAPNKFMGSGMLPAGAYVTLEHEYILILRKGPKREFKHPEEKRNRHESALFWEERNTWFSDVWMDLKGATQKLEDENVRKRSAAYRFEVPYRLINMYSVKGDLVLDPFFGIGTTMIAAMAGGRNSIGYEIEKNFKDTILSRISSVVKYSNDQIQTRLRSHLEFVENRLKDGGVIKHKNTHYGFPVITGQERELLLNALLSTHHIGDNRFETLYSDQPQNQFCSTREKGTLLQPNQPDSQIKNTKRNKASQSVTTFIAGLMTGVDLQIRR